jgi:CHASE3 domain sensor protein
MKPHLNTLGSFVAFALALSVLLTAGCKESKKAEIKEVTDKAVQATQKAVDKAQVAMSNAWSDLKGYTIEKKADFTAGAKAMSSKLDAQVSELRANFAEAKASARRKEAMEELKNSRAHYEEKLAALGRASADTWEAAKLDVIAAWNKVEASFHKAKAEKE